MALSGTDMAWTFSISHVDQIFYQILPTLCPITLHVYFCFQKGRTLSGNPIRMTVERVRAVSTSLLLLWVIGINLKMVIFSGDVSEAMLQIDGSNILGTSTHFFNHP